VRPTIQSTSTSRRALVALSKYSREKRAESTYRTLFHLPSSRRVWMVRLKNYVARARKYCY